MPTLSVSVTVSGEAAEAVNAWRATQLDQGGNPKYPSNAALAKSILKGQLRRILDQSPTASMLAEIAKKGDADSALESIKDSAVTD